MKDYITEKDIFIVSDKDVLHGYRMFVLLEKT